MRWAVAVVVLVGCTPKNFQYEPRGDELAALNATATRLADGSLRGDELDVDGRKALLVFGASLAYEKRERIAAAVNQVNASVVVALAFQVLGGWSPDQADAAMTASLEQQSASIDEQLSQEFGVSARQLLGGEALTALVTQLKEPRDERATRLMASLQADTPSSCRVTKPLVSYDLGLLRFTTWEHADLSKTFVAWKKRARSLHLVELVCDGRAGVVMLSLDDEHPGPRVVAWRFSSVDQHERLVARLQAGLR